MSIIAIGVSAQQSPHYTQYLFNPYVLNPAIAGTVDYYQLRMVNRLQWIGFTDAPFTASASMFGPLNKKHKNMGVGGSFLIDEVGPTSMNSINGSYAYNLNLSEEVHISGGITAGIIQYKLDGAALLQENDQNKVTGFSSDDEYLLGASEVKFLPDAMIGFYLWTTGYSVGISADKLFNNKFTMYNGKTAFSRLRSHIYLFGAYKFFINRKWYTEPSLMVKFVYPAIPQVDINAKAIYKNTMWAGLSFRTGDAIGLLGGYLYKKKYYLGISYDWTYSSIRNYNYGTFELFLGYKFDKLK